MAHTPEPWEIERTDEEGLDGVTIVSREGPVAFRVIDCSADLIAAAPELLAALRAAVTVLTGWECTSRLDAGDTETVRLCKAALAKAEGRTT